MRRCHDAALLRARATPGDEQQRVSHALLTASASLRPSQKVGRRQPVLIRQAPRFRLSNHAQVNALATVLGCEGRASANMRAASQVDCQL